MACDQPPAPHPLCTLVRGWPDLPDLCHPWGGLGAPGGRPARAPPPVGSLCSLTPVSVLPGARPQPRVSVQALVGTCVACRPQTSGHCFVCVSREQGLGPLC